MKLMTGKEFDVLVIGGGLAAMRAALESAAGGARTGLMLKGVLGASGIEPARRAESLELVEWLRLVRSLQHR